MKLKKSKLIRIIRANPRSLFQLDGREFKFILADDGCVYGVYFSQLAWA